MSLKEVWKGCSWILVEKKKSHNANNSHKVDPDKETYSFLWNLLSF